MNQCMGCQAGWRKREVPRHGAAFPPYTFTVHVVEGGYPGEIVGCTADRYDETKSEPEEFS